MLGAKKAAHLAGATFGPQLGMASLLRLGAHPMACLQPCRSVHNLVAGRGSPLWPGITPHSRSRLTRLLRCSYSQDAAAGSTHRAQSPSSSHSADSSFAPAFLPADPAPPGTTMGPPAAVVQHPCVSPATGTGALLQVPPSPLKRRRADHQDPLALAPTALAPAARTLGADLGKALRSVCKVYSTIANPSYATPWQMLQQTKSTATGFVIAPLSARRILTNAHAVANQIQVQLRTHGSSRKFIAKVLAVGHECDIAMLTVEDDEFWRGVEALDIGALPAMQDSVSVVGYPTGGDNVCVTKGVVSRVDRQQYSHGRTSLLALQIDAAINSGNSGGPVLKEDKVIGIAFQCLTQGENIGYVIPVPVIHHFLTDLARHAGRYTGFCDLGVCWQTLESSDHKAALGMPRQLSGVYVTAVEPCYHAAQVLAPGDVITHFNGHTIADDGTFLFEPHMHLTSPPASPFSLPALTQTTAGNGQPAWLQNQSVSVAEHHMITAAAAGGSHMLLQSAETATGQFQAPRGAADGEVAHVVSVSGSSTSRDARDDEGAEGGQLATPMAAVTMPAVAGGQHQAGAGAQQHLVPYTSQHSAVPSSTSATSSFTSHHHHHHPHQSVRIDFRHLVSMNYEGDKCTLEVWRGGAMHSVQVQLSTPKQLVPVHSHDVKPSYFIFGGLVFTRLTNFYLRSTYGTDWTHKAPIKLCDRSFAGYKEAEGQEVVILSKVLAWECNAGYQDLGNVEVMKAGGVPVHNLAHLAHILTHAPGTYLRLDLQWNKVVMLDAERCRAAGQDILMQNNIPGTGCHPANLAHGALELPLHLKEATEKLLGTWQEAASPSAQVAAAGPLSKVPSLHFSDSTSSLDAALHTSASAHTSPTTHAINNTSNTSSASVNAVEPPLVTSPPTTSGAISSSGSTALNNAVGLSAGVAAKAAKVGPAAAGGDGAAGSDESEEEEEGCISAGSA